MRICFTHKKGLASAAPVAITEYLYFGCLLSLWIQLYNNDPMQLKRMANTPWIVRGSLILVFLFSVAYNELKKRVKHIHSSQK